MSKKYQVLARKYRPQTFADLMGQEVLVETLKNAIEHHRIPHALLLTGVRGIGKTTTARIIARALNCVGPDGKGSETISPCGKCNPCVDILNERHLDVIEMDAASRTSVDDIRKVIEAAYYKPSSARYKIQIIDEVHMLTKQAFNALLKTLEEPPEYTKFIFATTELQRVPDTIISRCVRFDLKRFDRGALKDLLQKTCDQEKITIQSEALALLAQAANGSARDGQSLLERAISLSPGTITDEAVRSMLGLSGQDDILRLLQTLLAGDTATVLTLFDEAYNRGADPDQLLSSLCDLIHEISCLKVSPKFTERSLLSKEQVQQAKDIANTLSIPMLTRLWQVLTKGREELKGAPTAAQAAEMVLIRACYLSDLPTADAVIRELAKQSGTAMVSAHDYVTPLAANVPPETTEKKSPKSTLSLPTFIDLINLFATHKEPLLKYEFENHVRLIQFKPDDCLIELSLTPDIAPGFSKKVRELLEKWTSTPWTLITHEEKKVERRETPRDHEASAPKTLREQQKETQDLLLSKARATPLVKAALDAFPGAELKDITPLNE